MTASPPEGHTAAAPSDDAATVHGLLDEAARRWPRHAALDYGGRTIRFRALADAVARLADGLGAAGVGPGDAVALLLPNTPWFVVSLFAVLRLGAHAVPLSPLDPPRALRAKLADSGAGMVLATDLDGLDARAVEAAALLAGAGLAGAGGAAPRVLVGSDATWRDGDGGAGEGRALDRMLGQASARPRPPPAVTATALALLQYTGGTTGEPRAAMLTHGNVVAAVGMYRLWARDEERETPGTERALGILPFSHVFGLTAVLLRLLADGNEVLLRPRFHAAETFRDIARHRVTRLAGVPTLWLGLLGERDAARDLGSLRICVSGGAPLPHAVRAAVEQMLGRPLRNGWGMTETAPAGTRVPHDAAPRPGLIGRPLPGVTLRLVDPDDPSRSAAAGAVGELAIRGANVFGGYWRRADETRRAFHDGFFLTGDLGRQEPDGLFTLVGRKGSAIITSGYKVYPAPIEAAIHEHGAVAEAIVIGVPHATRGMAPKAFVVPRPGATPPTLESLRDFLRDRLGPHERPVALSIRDRLPRSAAGKPLPAVLEAEERAAREKAGAPDPA